MRKLLLIAVFLILSGCAAGNAAEPEHVSDIPEKEPEVCVIAYELPEAMVLETGGGELIQQAYESVDGSYSVTAERIPADTLEEAIRTVSGFDMEDLTILNTKQDDAEIYHFAWSSGSEEGAFVSRCALAAKDGAYYALTVTRQAGECGENRAAEKKLFSSMRLIPKE